MSEYIFDTSAIQEQGKTVSEERLVLIENLPLIHEPLTSPLTNTIEQTYDMGSSLIFSELTF